MLISESRYQSPRRNESNLPTITSYNNNIAHTVKKLSKSIALKRRSIKVDSPTLINLSQTRNNRYDTTIKKCPADFTQIYDSEFRKKSLGAPK